MIGIIALHQEIYCKGEVLGKEFMANIAGMDVRIYFPHLKSKEMRDAQKKGMPIPLVPPTFARPWAGVDKQPINWGHLTNAERKTAAISFLACSVDCKLEDEERLADLLYRECVRWEEDFVNYCNLAGRQISNQSKDQWKKASPMSLEGSFGFIEKGATYYIDIKFKKESQFLSAEQISKAIEFSSSPKEFLIEYQLLLVAAESKRNRRNKHAIFDACSAVEMCLNKEIEKYARSLGMDAKDLPDKHRMLGDKFKLVKKIDANFPDINAEKIVDLRNDIAHSRKTIFTDIEAEEIIHYAELCLEHYMPELF